MTVMQISQISLTLQIVTLAVLLTLSVKLISESERNLTAVFMSFYFALWLLTDLYWLVYDLMRPDMRMPFAANEIGEAAMFLMGAATINSAVKHRTRLPMGYLAGIHLFAISNVVLWILWSGEIVQDIIVGTVFIWFFYSIVRALRWSQALSSREWIVLAVLCTALIISQGLTFIVPENVKPVPDTCAYLLLIAGGVFFIYKLIRAYKGGLAYAQLFLSYALVIWQTMAKYMSGGNWYNLFLTLGTIGIPLWYMSVRKVVKAE